MGHSDPGLSQPLQDLSWGLSQQAPSSSRVSSSCLCLSQRRGTKTPLESCLLCPGLAVNAAFSSHPQHCKHYPHCRTRERGSRVAELTPELSAPGSALPGYVARSPGGRSRPGPVPVPHLQQAFSRPVPGRPHAKSGFFHTLWYESSGRNPQWSSCLIWKKSKKPDKKPSMYQPVSSHGHGIDAIVLLRGGSVPQRSLSWDVRTRE